MINNVLSNLTQHGSIDWSIKFDVSNDTKISLTKYINDVLSYYSVNNIEIDNELIDVYSSILLQLRKDIHTYDFDTQKTSFFTFNYIAKHIVVRSNLDYTIDIKFRPKHCKVYPNDFKLREHLCDSTIMFNDFILTLKRFGFNIVESSNKSIFETQEDIQQNLYYSIDNMLN